MFNSEELFLKCLELTKNDAYTRNVTMWCQAADGLYTFMKTKKEAEINNLRDMMKQKDSISVGVDISPAIPVMEFATESAEVS